MPKDLLKGEYWLHKDKVYKIIRVSRATNEVTIEDIKDGKQYVTAYNTFHAGYQRVIRVSGVARLLGRHPRSIYRYEARGLIRKPTTYDHKGSQKIRFYTKQDVFEIHEMISQIHQGRPAKSRRTTNNTLLDLGTLKTLWREKYGD